MRFVTNYAQGWSHGWSQEHGWSMGWSMGWSGTDIEYEEFVDKVCEPK